MSRRERPAWRATLPQPAFFTWPHPPRGLPPRKVNDRLLARPEDRRGDHLDAASSAPPERLHSAAGERRGAGAGAATPPGVRSAAQFQDRCPSPCTGCELDSASLRASAAGAAEIHPAAVRRREPRNRTAVEARKDRAPRPAGARLARRLHPPEISRVVPNEREEPVAQVVDEELALPLLDDHQRKDVEAAAACSHSSAGDGGRSPPSSSRRPLARPSPREAVPKAPRAARRRSRDEPRRHAREPALEKAGEPLPSEAGSPVMTAGAR